MSTSLRLDIGAASGNVALLHTQLSQSLVALGETAHVRDDYVRWHAAEGRQDSWLLWNLELRPVVGRFPIDQAVAMVSLSGPKLDADLVQTIAGMNQYNFVTWYIEDGSVRCRTTFPFQNILDVGLLRDYLLYVSKFANYMAVQSLWSHLE